VPVRASRRDVPVLQGGCVVARYGGTRQSCADQVLATGCSAAGHAATAAEIDRFSPGRILGTAPRGCGCVVTRRQRASCRRRAWDRRRRCGCAVAARADHARQRHHRVTTAKPPNANPGTTATDATHRCREDRASLPITASTAHKGGESRPRKRRVPLTNGSRQFLARNHPPNSGEVGYRGGRSRHRRGPARQNATTAQHELYERGQRKRDNRARGVLAVHARSRRGDRAGRHR